MSRWRVCGRTGGDKGNSEDQEDEDRCVWLGRCFVAAKWCDSTGLLRKLEHWGGAGGGLGENRKFERFWDLQIDWCAV